MELKLLKCKSCGKIVERLPGTHGCATVCCGSPMVELTANSQEASLEKHIPVVLIDGNHVHVQVGSVEHPMIEEHHIQFIYLVTDKATHRVDLTPGGKPVADFYIENEKPLKVYEYCNLHGLWVKEL